MFNFRTYIFGMLIALTLAGIEVEAQNDSMVLVIKGVIVTGNKVTKDHIVLREMLINEEDTLSPTAMYALIERSRNNLVNTSLFNTVHIIPAFLSARDVILQVEVEERWYTWPIPIFELAETNFNTWWLTKDLTRTNYGFYIARQNFRGRRESLYLKLRFGYSKQYAIRYQIPSINKAQDLGMGINLNYFQNREITVGTEGNIRIFYSPQEKGNSREEFVGETNFTYRGGIYNRHIGRLKYTKAVVDDSVVVQHPGYFQSNKKDSEYFTISYTFQHDKRDVKAYPLRGHLLEVTAVKDGIGSLGQANINLLTGYLSLKKYWQLGGRTFFASGARFKSTINDPPYYNQEGLGYSNYVRGYEFYVIDGQHFALLRNNLKYQIVRPRVVKMGKFQNSFFSTFQFAFYLNAFFDLGYVADGLYNAQNPLANDIMNGYGLGLDLVTIYDYVLRMEVSRNKLGETGFFLHFRQPI